MENKIKVVKYQFIDNLQHIIRPEEIGYDDEHQIERVKKAFTDHGWEGDGEIGLIWLPPFICRGQDTLGEYVWHVKQDNNGISFLGYETSSISYRMSDSYESCLNEGVTVTHFASKGLLECIGKYRSYIKKLDSVSNTLDKELYSITINAIQNHIVADFIDYIDELYLQFLDHVFQDDNPDRLKLSKINVKLPLDIICKGIDGYMDSWMIISQIMSAVWKDFKFKPFKDKFKEICNIIDYKCDDTIKKRIICHVEIRNSIQHHGGQFVSDMKKTLGQDHIELLDKDGKKQKFSLWSHIELSIPELYDFCKIIETFIQSYEEYVAERMTSRCMTNTDRNMAQMNTDYDMSDVNIVEERIELINYIYYLQYYEEMDDIYVETKDHIFTVYESSTFKVNYEECTSQEFYKMLLSISETVVCNGKEFVYDGTEYISKEKLKIAKPSHSSIITL